MTPYDPITRRKKNDVFHTTKTLIKRDLNSHRFKLVEMPKNETKRKKNPKKRKRVFPALKPSNAFPSREKRRFLFPGKLYAVILQIIV
jgi:hypothetical protein